MASESGGARRGGSNSLLVSICSNNSSRRYLERYSEEGDRPVGERIRALDTKSTSEHEEFWRNKWGPSHKAKYDHVTDSEEYREGTVKRTPGGEWKRTWNRVLTSRQRTTGNQSDVVPFVEWAGELRCYARLRDKVSEPKRKRVWIGREV